MKFITKYLATICLAVTLLAHLIAAYLAVGQAAGKVIAAYDAIFFVAYSVWIALLGALSMKEWN
jgi:hypothetical protein